MNNGYQPKGDGKKLLPPTGGSNIISPKNATIGSSVEIIIRVYEEELKATKEQVRKKTAKKILKAWYRENIAKGDEQDYVLELAEKYGVEIEK